MQELENKVLDFVISSESPWDKDLVTKICEEFNLTSNAFKLAFPNGLERLADIFFKRVDEDMLLEKHPDGIPIHVQVANLLKARLQYMMKHRKSSLSILKMDCSVNFKLHHLYHVSDLIWGNVKHKTEGFDYYTRRMILSCIYKNCLFFFKKQNLPEAELIDFMMQQFKYVGFITKMKKKFCS